MSAQIRRNFDWRSRSLSELDARALHATLEMAQDDGNGDEWLKATRNYGHNLQPAPPMRHAVLIIRATRGDYIDLAVDVERRMNQHWSRLVGATAGGAIQPVAIWHSRPMPPEEAVRLHRDLSSAQQDPKQYREYRRLTAHYNVLGAVPVDAIRPWRSILSPMTPATGSAGPGLSGPGGWQPYSASPAAPSTPYQQSPATAAARARTAGFGLKLLILFAVVFATVAILLFADNLGWLDFATGDRAEPATSAPAGDVFLTPVPLHALTPIPPPTAIPAPAPTRAPVFTPAPTPTPILAPTSCPTGVGLCASFSTAPVAALPATPAPALPPIVLPTLPTFPPAPTPFPTPPPLPARLLATALPAAPLPALPAAEYYAERGYTTLAEAAGLPVGAAPTNARDLVLVGCQMNPRYPHEARPVGTMLLGETGRYRGPDARYVVVDIRPPADVDGDGEEPPAVTHGVCYSVAVSPGRRDEEWRFCPGDTYGGTCGRTEATMRLLPVFLSNGYPVELKRQDF